MTREAACPLEERREQRRGRGRRRQRREEPPREEQTLLSSCPPHRSRRKRVSPLLLQVLAVCLFLLSQPIRGDEELDAPISVNTNILSEVLDRLTNKTTYDKRLRPRYGDKPVDVGITIHVSSISAVSEVDMDFTLDFYMRQTWQDPRLAFGLLDLGLASKIQSLTVGVDYLDRLWKPDTFFPNEKKSFFHLATTHNSFLRIDSDGTVYTSQRLTVTATCPMKLQLFPMDSQRCKLEIESYGYSVLDINYVFPSNESVTRSSFELPQFVLVDVKISNKTEKLSSGVYSRLVTFFFFKRNIGFYIIQIYLPSILIVVISWVSFWLSRDATPARIGLGVTTVLTMTTLMTTTNAAMPKVSYVKSIDIFLGVSFLMVFASLLEYAAVGYISKRIRLVVKRKETRAAPSSLELPQRSLSVPAYYNTAYRPFYSSTDRTSHLFIENTRPPAAFACEAECLCPVADSSTPLLLGHRPDPVPPPLCPQAMPLLPKESCTSYQPELRQLHTGRFRAFARYVGRLFRPNNIDASSRWIFPTIFVIFNLTYWSYFMRISQLEAALPWND